MIYKRNLLSWDYESKIIVCHITYIKGFVPLKTIKILEY